MHFSSEFSPACLARLPLVVTSFPGKLPERESHPSLEVFACTISMLLLCCISFEGVVYDTPLFFCCFWPTMGFDGFCRDRKILLPVKSRCENQPRGQGLCKGYPGVVMLTLYILHVVNLHILDGVTLGELVKLIPQHARHVQ